MWSSVIVLKRFHIDNSQSHYIFLFCYLHPGYTIEKITLKMYRHKFISSTKNNTVRSCIFVREGIISGESMFRKS